MSCSSATLQISKSPRHAHVYAQQSHLHIIAVCMNLYDSTHSVLFSDYIIQYAVWDLAFHMIPFARIDPEFAKKQLELFLSEKYMAPNGQIPGQI